MATRIGKLLLLAFFALAACTASGPQKTLNNLAEALENNNPQTFLAQFEMDKYASNYLRNLTHNDNTLNSLNAIGNLFGLGDLDQVINSLVDMRGRLTGQLERGVASGELMAQCRSTDKLDCPWVPNSLRNAQIIELSQNAAIAKITTPMQLTSWLALHKYGEQWLVVGQAVLENRARAYAIAGGKPQTPPLPRQQRPVTGSGAAVDI